MFGEFWEDLFNFPFSPWDIHFGPHRPFKINYRRKGKSHILRIKITPDVKKEEIKARLIEPGILEIEWPRKIRGEEIPVE